MAVKRSVWGIDIGQSALKALKCRISDDGQGVVAESFDYVEYPKLLSSPEANPAELISDALDQFLSRNETRGDEIALSVPGNTGLARFFKPPPVEAKVLPQLVEFEAKQQIPFPLDEVIWDWQSLGGHEVEGFQLDNEVGIFAMKREHVARAIKPFLDKKLEPSVVQLSPLTVFNAVAQEKLKDIDQGDYDPDNPPPHTLVLSMGTETTDLIFTNGHTLWLRSIPIGGNHFTKILSKELKLTHAKAEQLKRHVMEAEDPKAVFQVMRPVFNDLVNELQRSIRHYQTIDRKAKIEKALLIGAASKLRGLSQYVEQNLGIPVSRLKKFDKLEGSEVVNAETFHSNAAGFAGAYGLCLQGCGASKLQTSLLPPEIITDRIVREKKPWAVAAVALVLLGFAANAAFQVWRTWEVNPQQAGADGTTWDAAIAMANPVKSESDAKTGKDAEQIAQLAHIRALGDEVVGNADRKLVWLELLSALEVALPDSSAQVPRGQVPDPKTYPFDQRTELYIESMEAQFFPDLALWWTEPVQRRYAADEAALKGRANRRNRGANAEGDADEAVDAATVDPAAAGADPAATDPAAAGVDPAATDPAAPVTEGDAVDAATTEGDTPEGTPAAGPTEQGWVIELSGHHFHNSRAQILDSGENYLRRTLIRQLREGEVALPVPSNDPTAPPEMITFTFEELGIQFPIISATGNINNSYKIPNPNADPAMGMMMEGSPYGAAMPGAPGAGSGRRQGGAGRTGGRAGGRNGAEAGAEEEAPEPEPEFYTAPRYDFKVQFVWKETPLSKRIQARRQAAEAAAAAQAAEGDESTVAPTESIVPSVLDPSAMDPVVADPLVTDPALVDPAAVDPADPAAVDPAAVDPATAIPPDASPPGTAPPAGVDPAATEPVDPAAAGPVDPAATEPEAPVTEVTPDPAATATEGAAPAETPAPANP
ncbi:MAG TPA: type IV pilus assembly protein PilM [Pirellulaceae bacterium]|jgi:type IV pilus assembly protein PilM|nr:type IV pilus assembly protein PilM [Pirellulaceae bacterium]